MSHVAQAGVVPILLAPGASEEFDRRILRTVRREIGGEAGSTTRYASCEQNPPNVALVWLEATELPQWHIIC